MSDEDLRYFENEFYTVVLEFIHSLTIPVKNGINIDNFDYYLELSTEKFIDCYEDEESAHPDKVYGLESSHYTLCFFFDLI
jgi:hypothetical protein